MWSVLFVLFVLSRLFACSVWFSSSGFGSCFFWSVGPTMLRFCRALRSAASRVYCIWNSPLSLKSLSQRCLSQSGRRLQLRSTVASSEVSSSSAVLCFPSCCLRPRSSLRPRFSASQDFFVPAVFFVHTHVRSKGIDENYRHRFFLFFRIRFKFRGLGRKNAKIRVDCFFAVYCCCCCCCCCRVCSFYPAP